MSQRSATIVGGGIGGLSAAIALAQRGWSVRLLEQAPAFTEVGAGVQISPNGVKVLAALGVLPLLAAQCFEPEAIEIRQGRSGRLLLHLPLRAVTQARWGAPYLTLHRADLLAALLVRAQQFPQLALHLGQRVTALPEDELVVAADGVRSTLRAALFPGLSGPRFTGQVAWRALVPAAEMGGRCPPPSSCIWTGPGRHAVTTRVHAGRTVNFVGLVEHPVRPGQVPAEGWSTPGSRADAQALFGGWSPVIDALLTQADSFLRWGLFDHPPLPALARGRVALVGDAAHPMLPSKAQGAVMALEDGWVLARELSATTDLPAALDRYSALRLPRVTRVQQGAAANVRLFHHRSALAQLRHYLPIWLAGRLAREAVYRRDDWLFGADIL